MAQVPYSPVPTVAPSGQGIPNLSAAGATPDAFGANVGRAIEGLGQKVEGAGNELFARAQALQQLNNESEAKQADADYMIKAGNLHANYSSLQGKDAVDAYPGYVKDLEKARIDLRGSLSNDMARKMYDTSSLSNMSRTIFNGAGHAATQNKQWAIGTATAQMDLDAKMVVDNPKEEGLFQDKLDRTKANAQNVAALKGFGIDSPLEKDLTLKATSQLWASRVVGLSRTDPFSAAKMLDANKSQFTEGDFLKVDQSVRSQSRAVGSVNIANGVYSAGTNQEGKLDKPMTEMDEEVKAQARKQDPDDPLLEKHAVDALHGIYNQNKYAARQETYENSQIIDGKIQAGVKNVQELRADPKVAAAMDALPKDKQLAIPGAINRFNAARDKDTNQDTYQRLYGLSNNDVEGFLNTDITKEQLSQTDMRKLQGMQQKMKDNQNSDPRVNRAVGQMRAAFGPQMEALGIFKRTDANKEDFDHFTGAVQTALDSWQESHGKPASYQDIVKTIGPQVMQERSEPGWLWGSNKKPFFNQTVPSEFAEGLKKDVVEKGGVEPTDEQVYRAFIRTQFSRLYGSKKDQSQVGK